MKMSLKKGPFIHQTRLLRKLTRVLRCPDPLYVPALDITLEVNELWGMMAYRVDHGFPTYLLAWRHDPVHETWTHFWVQMARKDGLKKTLAHF